MLMAEDEVAWMETGELRRVRCGGASAVSGIRKNS